MNETGRSMVEMLGVLAIIGVLSVGGIAGYTLAMRKYKVNNLVDCISKMSVEAQVVPSNGTAPDMAAVGYTTTEVGGCTVEATAGTGAITVKTCTDAKVKADAENMLGSNLGGANGPAIEWK